MANFTQLNLDNPAPKSHKNIQDIFATEKVLFCSGVLAIAAISGILLLVANGCSRGSRSVGVNPEPAAPITSSPLVPSSAPVVAAVQPPAVAPRPAHKRVQHRAPLAAYTQPAYGVSFRYPKSYILKTGDEPQKDLAGLGPVQTAFVEPGAVTLAALELPRASYPGTDFTSAFFSLSVNSAISPQQCQRFAFPMPEHPENEPATVSNVKIAGKDFAMIEDFGNAANSDPRTKYFHHFENGICYEFGIRLNTTGADIAGLKPVNRSLVFGRLEQVLASVKLQPPEAQTAKTSGTNAPEARTQIAKAPEAKAAEPKASGTKSLDVVKDAPTAPMPDNNHQ
jgi:hypothetical protein